MSVPFLLWYPSWGNAALLLVAVCMSLSPATEDVKERQDKLTDDVDAILDEIDEVLEENAEEFVRSYVQKGGQ